MVSEARKPLRQPKGAKPPQATELHLYLNRIKWALSCVKAFAAGPLVRPLCSICLISRRINHERLQPHVA